MVNIHDIKKQANLLNINDTYIQRLARLVEAYNYNTESDLIPFFTLIYYEPQKFKNIPLLTSKWKKNKSLSEILRSITSLAKLPIIKDNIGDKYENIMKKHEEFRNYMIKFMKRQEKSHQNQDDDNYKNPPNDQNNDTQSRKNLFENDDEEDYKNTIAPIQEQLNEDSSSSSSSSSSEHKKQPVKKSKKDSRNKVISQKTYKKIKHKIEKIQQYTDEIEGLMKKSK